jgi:hypothetical protein
VILAPRVYLLRGQGGRVRILWRPRILTPSGPIMAKAIVQANRNKELLTNPYPGEDVVASRSIQLFQLATGGLRLGDKAAADLYQIIRKALKEEGLMP